MPPTKRQSRKRPANGPASGSRPRRSPRSSTRSNTAATLNAAPLTTVVPPATLTAPQEELQTSNLPAPLVQLPATVYPPAAGSNATSPISSITPEQFQELVSSVTAAVNATHASTPRAEGPLSTSPPSAPAAVLPQSGPMAMPSSTSGFPDTANLVTGAIAAAHASISGEPQLLPTIRTSFGHSPASSAEPTQIFHSASLPLDSRISAKLKGKIWNEEFVAFGSLLSLSNTEHEKFQISFMNSEAGLPASFCLEPASRPKNIQSIEVWLQAFHIFVGIYTKKYPHEAPALMKYGQTIQDLASRGQNWRFYDENFRFLRQTQRSLVPWGSIHGELWLRSQYSMNVTRKHPPVPPIRQNRFSNDSRPRPNNQVPWGYCFKFHRGLTCSGCDFSHTCFKCQGNHRGNQCESNFRVSKGKSRANDARNAKSNAITHAGKNSALN